MGAWEEGYWHRMMLLSEKLAISLTLSNSAGWSWRRDGKKGWDGDLRMQTKEL